MSNENPTSGACSTVAAQIKKPRQTLRSLWAQFLPLSMSDVTMAFGDPLITLTLAHLSFARVNLAAVGVAKAMAVFFESPIIMMLHASNTMAKTKASRKALWRFMLLAGGILTALLALTVVPGVFRFVAGELLGVEKGILEIANIVLGIMVIWPFAIAWRRYFQGLLIHSGHASAVARAGICRLLMVGSVLGLGFLQGVHGAVLAASALVAGIITEAVIVTVIARRYNVKHATPDSLGNINLPTNMRGMWGFYWPLAASMLVVWGGRAALIGVVARAHDGAIALAAWPAAWGLVLVIANATRMVQQIVIKYKDEESHSLLFAFALSAGGLCSLFLLLVAVTPPGQAIVTAFVGDDEALVQSVRPVVLVCAAIPLIVALQNALQGFLIGEGRTHRVNVATWFGTFVLLAGAFVAISAGASGAVAAALAMVGAMASETIVLAAGIRDKVSLSVLLKSGKMLIPSVGMSGMMALWRSR